MQCMVYGFAVTVCSCNCDAIHTTLRFVQQFVLAVFLLPLSFAECHSQLHARGHADRSIEFWDVGGNPDAALARGVFFEDSEAAGVLLVYDASNPR